MKKRSGWNVTEHFNPTGCKKRREKDEIEKGIKIIGQTIDEIKQSV